LCRVLTLVCTCCGNPSSKKGGKKKVVGSSLITKKFALEELFTRLSYTRIGFPKVLH